MKNKKIFLILTAFVLFTSFVVAQNNTNITTCPLWTPPSPDFCKNGTIISGGSDQNGCSLPPQCVTNQTTKLVKEQITCNFHNSNLTQKCNSDKGSCSGVNSCLVDVVGMMGEQITWKSSCGSYMYTTLDGRNEIIGFNCIETINNSQIENNISIGCYHGNYKIGDSWVIDKCNNTCICIGNEQTKCTSIYCPEELNNVLLSCYHGSYKVGDSWKIDECNNTCICIGNEQARCSSISCPSHEINQTIINNYSKPINFQECYGCFIDTSCAPYGYRMIKDGIEYYCDLSSEILKQREMGDSCQNNYECKSNECSNGKCISTYSLLESILNWLKSLFG